jgi:hypothetical protein
MAPRVALPAAERRLYSRLRQLLNEPGALRGSLVQYGRRCGKPTCRCAKDAKARHPTLLLCFSRDGKQTSVYVPPAWEERVREWVARYGEIREVLDQLSQQYLARLKARQE